MSTNGLTVGHTFKNFNYTLPSNSKIDNKDKEKTETQTKEKNKTKMSATKILGTAGPMGMFHGLYRKYYASTDNFFTQNDANVLETVLKVDPQYTKGDIEHRKILAEIQGTKAKPIAHFVTKKGGSEIGCAGMPNNPFKKAKDGLTDINLSRSKEYSYFVKKLNPYDNLILNKIRRIPFGNKIADFMLYTKSPIKELRIGRRMFYYDATSILKGMGAVTVVGLAAGLAIDGLVKLVKNKQNKKEDETN